MVQGSHDSSRIYFFCTISRLLSLLGGCRAYAMTAPPHWFSFSLLFLNLFLIFLDFVVFFFLVLACWVGLSHTIPSKFVRTRLWFSIEGHVPCLPLYYVLESRDLGGCIFQFSFEWAWGVWIGRISAEWLR